jgi:hypothetical protein
MYEWDTDEYRAAMDASYDAIRRRHPDLVTRPFECWAGWHDIIGRFFDEVAAILEAHPDAEFDLFQVKEKYASLTIYADTSPEIRGLVAAAYGRAMAEAKRTCDVCGQPGRLLRRQGCYMTRCEEHAEGGKSIEWDQGKRGWPKT